MHRDLRELLRSAMGDSQHVIAVNADVRGFSAFSEGVESVQAALYLQKLYERMLDDYFDEATYFKPTGDGLLVIYAFDPKDVTGVSREVVRTSLRLVKNFPALCRDDPMLNFRLPDELGIGLARGAATRLVAPDGRVLDYSGRPLNLASRLMDLARPQGVVFDESFRPQLLTPAQRAKFDSVPQVYIRSIAEGTPIKVFFTAGLTVIPERHLNPLDRPIWTDLPSFTYKLREIVDIGALATNYRVDLPSRPLSTSNIQVAVTSPARTASGAKHPTLSETRVLTDEEWHLLEFGGKPALHINFASLGATLVGGGAKPSWPVKVTVSYAPE